MAVKASCDVITNRNEDCSQFSSLLGLILKLIPDFVQNQDYDVLLCTLNMFDDLNLLDGDFYIDSIPSIIDICCKVFLFSISSYL